MTHKPVAAGKSSLDHVDRDLAFAQIITPGASRYLDLACGAGRYTLALAERLGPEVTIHALDLWQEGIDALRATASERGLRGIRPQRADITAPLPLEDNSVDVSFMATALHDLPAPSHLQVLREIRRVLAPGGTFVLIEFKRMDRGPGPGIDQRIGEEQADALALPLGFEKQAVVDLGEFPYLVKYTRP